MFRQVSTALWVIFAATTAVSAQDAAETAAWDAARDSGKSEEVFAFIQQHPDGEFAKQAKALMIDLLWAELASNETDAAPDTTPEPELTPVTFDAPLTDGSAEIVGKTMEQLLAAAPLFPPVEGLPEELWAEQQCSSCHQWERANLCELANTYLTEAGAENLIKPHPYGGTFKLNLRTWAQGGCE